jgi:hypothetical protein
MEPATLALIAAALLIVSSKGQGAYGEGSTKYLLTPGTYRVRFRSAKPQTDSLQQIWAIPHATMMGTGGQTRFESMAVDNTDPNYWWFTGLMSYAGNAQTIDLFPQMTVEKLA